MKVEAYVAKVEAEMARHSHQAMLGAGPDPSLFAYGRTIGYYAGLAKAIELIRVLLSEEDGPGQYR